LGLAHKTVKYERRIGRFVNQRDMLKEEGELADLNTNNLPLVVISILGLVVWR